MAEISSKAIFIGGVGRSGTTLMTQLLDKHREIASFGETKLVDHRIFLSFPRWIYECPPKQKIRLVNLFKQLCLTRFFRFRLTGVNPRLMKVWKHLENIWLLRFQHPQSFAWSNPIWPAIEKFWLLEAIQGCTFFSTIPGNLRDQDWMGLRGLYYRNTSSEFSHLFSRNDIRQNFVVLDELKEANTLDETYRIYGRFWNAVFGTYVQKRNKKYWAEKTPANALHGLFLKKCFDNLKMINLVRDGRDVACSTMAMWGGDLRPALDRWGKWLTETLEAQKKMPKSCYINVRYEDLVLQTRSLLKRIMDFLEVNFDQTMLLHQINPGSVGRYKDSLTWEMKAYAKDRYGHLLRQWGYFV